MPNLLILYKSKYGATKKYAALLHEELPSQIMDIRQFTPSSLEGFGQIVLAGGIYAGGIAGLSLFKKHLPKFQGKRLAIFCVGASPYEESAIQELKKRHLKGSLSDVPLFYGRGAWNPDKMTFKDRTLCRLLAKSLTNTSPENLEPWMKALLEASGKTCDWVDPSYLAPLVAYLKS